MDKSTFQEKVLVLQHKMFRFAVSYMKSETDAMDVVQDVLMKLWEDRNSLHQKDNLEAWSMTLVRNKSLDKLKRVERKLKSDWESAMIVSPPSGKNPSKEYDHAEGKREVEKVLEELPEALAKTFHLREIQGYAYAEIAEVLDLNMSQVKVNLFRARKAVREKLEKMYAYGV